MRSSEATEIVSDLAAQQWGLFTAAQARSAGVAAFLLSRLVDQGVLLRIRHGVYASSSTPWSPALDVRAQWLALEPTVMAADRRTDQDRGPVVSHETAADLHGIGDLPSNTITFTTPQRRQTKQSDVRFRTATLTSDEIVSLEGLPVTTVPRTLWDLAQAGHEPGHLSDMITDAITNQLTTKDELATALGTAAELFGATDNTVAAMRARLEELAPDPAAGEDPVARAVREAVAPLQQQIQELMTRLSSQAYLPEGWAGMSAAAASTENLESVVSPEIREMLKNAAASGAMSNTTLHPGTDPGVFNITQDKLLRSRSEDARDQAADMGDDEDEHG